MDIALEKIEMKMGGKMGTPIHDNPDTDIFEGAVHRTGTE